MSTMYEVSDTRTIKPEIPARWGISGSTLKMIAIVTMLIDHIGAVVVERGIFQSQYLSKYWEEVDLILRFTGRVAFPIFCFLLVEGFQKTHDRRRYLLRLGAFCLISEVPFDLAFRGVPFYWGYQSVFWTLTIGFCVLWGMETLQKQASWSRLARGLASAGVLLVGMILANHLRTDYSSFGVLFIALFWCLSNQAKWVRNIVCGVACAWEITAPLALIPIHFYNGQRGWPLKYFFYCFYPVHLLILALLTRWYFGV